MMQRAQVLRFMNDSSFFGEESDPMLDLQAQEDEAQAVSDLHNGYLCTVE